MILTRVGPGLYQAPGRRLFAFLEERTLTAVCIAGWYACSRDGEPSHPATLKIKEIKQC